MKYLASLIESVALGAVGGAVSAWVIEFFRRRKQRKTEVR